MTYTVKRNYRQKNLRMHVNDKGELIVSCPYCVSKDAIQTFVDSNKEWIEKQQSKIVKRSFTTGDSVPFWGKTYFLHIQKATRNKVVVDYDSLLVMLPNPDDSAKVQKQLYRFYKENLYAYACNKIRELQSIMGFEMPKVAISNAKTTWGVCYSKKNLIKFSAMTACLEEDLIDMIIIHELCHLKFQDHSPLFWAEVAKYVDDLDTKKARLRKASKTGLNRNLF